MYDMLGNAGELVEDCQHLTYEGAPADGAPWTTGCTDFHGVKTAIHRGGSYNNAAIGASPTIRGHAGLDNRSSTGEGFRIAEDEEGDADRGADAKPVAALLGFEAGLAKAQAAERGRQRAQGNAH